MWFRRNSAPATDQLVFSLGHELSLQLRRVARARNRSPQALALDLALRARAETALQALTPREREVVQLTARGHTNRQIVEELVICPETVKTHVRHALEKFSLHGKSELRMMLLELRMRW